MKNLFTVFFLALSLNLLAQDFKPITDQLDSSKVLSRHYFGFSLFDIDEQKYVYGRNEDKHFTPASNTKVFTLFTSLKLIGDSIPGIAYVERGDSLIFWGTGDPTFLHSRLGNSKVLDFLRNSSKKLYLALQPNQEPYYRDGWSIEDYEFYYQPELSQFPIYGNVVQFKEVDGKLKLDPAYFEKYVKSLTDTITRYRIHRPIDNNNFEINNFPLPLKYVNEKPFKTSDSLLLSLLQDTLKREVILTRDSLPSQVNYVYSTSTKDVGREMMLPSDNFLAEQLNMVASFKQYNAFRTADLRKFMKENYYKYFQDSIELRDGSGLSSYNKVTPRNMVELLLLVQNEVRDEASKLKLFPAGGLEGTLKNVYPTPEGKAFVWAKTGTINSVHCQSGYILTKKNKRYAYSFLNNNFLGSAGPVRKEMVKIITYIYDNY